MVENEPAFQRNKFLTRFGNTLQLRSTGYTQDRADALIQRQSVDPPLGE